MFCCKFLEFMVCNQSHKDVSQTDMQFYRAKYAIELFMHGRSKKTVQIHVPQTVALSIVVFMDNLLRTGSDVNIMMTIVVWTMSRKIFFLVDSSTPNFCYYMIEALNEPCVQFASLHMTMIHFVPSVKQFLIFFCKMHNENLFELQHEVPVRKKNNADLLSFLQCFSSF